MKIKKLLICILLIAFSLGASAQLYRTGLGARLGYFNGITVKHFFASDRALEGLLTSRWGGFIITGLYEYQKSFQSAPGLAWEIGGGAHFGTWNDSYDYYGHHYNSGVAIGIDFILGLEYKFPSAPFVIGLDYKPAMNIVNTGWWSDGVGLSLKFTFR
jgi:hypothetical protein